MTGVRCAICRRQAVRGFYPNTCAACSSRIDRMIKAGNAALYVEIVEQDLSPDRYAHTVYLYLASEDGDHDLAEYHCDTYSRAYDLASDMARRYGASYA